MEINWKDTHTHHKVLYNYTPGKYKTVFTLVGMKVNYSEFTLVRPKDNTHLQPPKVTYTSACTAMQGKDGGFIQIKTKNMADCHCALFWF